jgi:hypothetical protein
MAGEPEQQAYIKPGLVGYGYKPYSDRLFRVWIHTPDGQVIYNATYKFRVYIYNYVIVAYDDEY